MDDALYRGVEDVWTNPRPANARARVRHSRVFHRVFRRERACSACMRLSLQAMRAFPRAIAPRRLARARAASGVRRRSRATSDSTTAPAKYLLIVYYLNPLFIFTIFHHVHFSPTPSQRRRAHRRIRRRATSLDRIARATRTRAFFTHRIHRSLSSASRATRRETRERGARDD